jgi:hypothetical protein
VRLVCSAKDIDEIPPSEKFYKIADIQLVRKNAPEKVKRVKPFFQKNNLEITSLKHG